MTVVFFNDVVYIGAQYYTFYGLLSVVLSPSLQLSAVASTIFYAIWSLFAGGLRV